MTADPKMGTILARRATGAGDAPTWDDIDYAARCIADARREVDRLRAEREGDRPVLMHGESARAHARRRGPLDGADAQALEGALTITERERDEARAAFDRLRALRDADRALIGEASEAWAVLTGKDPQSGRPSGSCVIEARREAELAEVRARDASYLPLGERRRDGRHETHDRTARDRGALLAHVDALTARLEAETAASLRNLYEMTDMRNAAMARAEAAEKRLAALVQAHRAMCTASAEHRTACEAEIAEMGKPVVTAESLDELGDRVANTAKAAHATARAFQEAALRAARGES